MLQRTITRATKRYLMSGAVAISVFVVGCATQPSAPTPDFANNRDADSLVVTDCLLPGQVRQLGSRRSYLTPRRPIKTTISDCEIRGGEYVAYDRANYATALKIWLPRAQEGDPDAQTYVGEIYEKGLGIQADYNIASQWYRKAAEQGNSRAAINLGYLYEAGLGVDQDLSQAMNWYRAASGLTDGTVEYVSSLEKVKRKQAVVDQKLLTEEVARLKVELSNQKALLTQTRNGYKQQQQDVENLKSQLAKRSEIVAVKALERAQALSAADNTDEIKALRAREIDLGRQLKSAQAEQLRLSESLANTSLSRLELDDKLGTTNRELASAKAALEKQEAMYADAQQLLTEQSTAIAAKGSQEKLVLTLATTRAELLNQRNKVSNLEITLESNQKSLVESQAEQLRLSDSLADTSLSRLELDEKLGARNLELASAKADLKEQEAQYAKAQQLQAEQSAALATKDAQGDLALTLASTKAELLSQRNKVSDLEVALSNSEQSRADGQEEQARLSDSLADTSLSRLELDEQLSVRNQELASAKAALREQEAMYADAQQQLSEQKVASAAKDSQEDLALTLASTKAELLRQRNKVSDLEIALTGKGQSQTAKLNSIRAQLESQQAEVARLADNLSSEQISSQEKIDQLLASKDRDQNTIASLKSQLGTGQTEQARLAEELMSVQLAALSATDEETGNLKGQLADREKQLENQQARIVALERQVTERQAGLNNQQNNEAVVAANTVGPSIEIIEPPLTLTRSSPSILLRSNVPSVQVVGKVDSSEPLLAFTINGIKQNIDENGIFTTDWKVDGGEGDVAVVAVDKLGNRTSLDFKMIAASGGPASTQTPKQKKSNAVGDINFGSYYALVIGNNKYQYMTNLKSAVTDAKAVAGVLEQQYGFDTTLLINATRYDILSELNKLREKLTEDDNLLIYYAGHGELDKANQRGYWLPVDAETDSSTNWISNVAITDILNVMSARHVLAVVDSCYSLALTRNAVARLDTGWTSEQHKDWYKAMRKTRARTVLTAGGLKPVLDGGGGQHSVFAAAFLDSLRKNDSVLDGYKLYRAVQKHMKAATAQLNVEQEPQYVPIKFAGHEAGEFFLLPNSMRQAKLSTPAPDNSPKIYAAIN